MKTKETAINSLNRIKTMLRDQIEGNYDLTQYPRSWILESSVILTVNNWNRLVEYCDFNNIPMEYNCGYLVITYMW